MEKSIPFNLPYVTGKESIYIEEVLASRKFSGNGKYTNLCQQFFKDNYGFEKCLLTTSCTDALEMTAILMNIQPGDEVIIPSYTFVSTANAFILRGAKVVFADSMENHPNIDADAIEPLISKNTKAIIVVHYAGVACDMDKIMELAAKYSIYVVEDAAQAVDSYYINKNGEKLPLGGIGHFGCLSFHETKNIISGEGGMLIINDEQFFRRADIIWEKGTNRAEFFRGLVDKYSWVDLGSSFLPSELNAAFLWGQLQEIKSIQKKRNMLWEQYCKELSSNANGELIQSSILPDYATNNAHMFYIVCESLEQRDSVITALHSHNISTVFHYLSLHSSPYFKDKYKGGNLINSDKFSSSLLRLPMFFDLELESVEKICSYLIETIKN